VNTIFSINYNFSGKYEKSILLVVSRQVWDVQWFCCNILYARINIIYLVIFLMQSWTVSCYKFTMIVQRQVFFRHEIEYVLYLTSVSSSEFIIPDKGTITCFNHLGYVQLVFKSNSFVFNICRCNILLKNNEWKILIREWFCTFWKWTSQYSKTMLIAVT
jgi:hypothetical protein